MDDMDKIWTIWTNWMFMENLLTTIFIASIVLILGLLLFAIGWLVTGKSRIQPGACGKAPNKKRVGDDSCGSTTSCTLCDKTNEKTK